MSEQKQVQRPVNKTGQKPVRRRVVTREERERRERENRIRERRERLEREKQKKAKLLKFNIIVGTITLITVLFFAKFIFTKKNSLRREGIKCYKEANYSEAIEKFEKALDTKTIFANKVDADILMYEGECYLKLEEYEKAWECYKTLTDDYRQKYYDVDEVRFMITLTEALTDYKSGFVMGLGDTFANAYDHGYYDMALYAGICFGAEGKTEHMIEYFDKYADKYGMTPYLYYEYSKYYMDKDDTASALDMINKGMEADSDYKEALWLNKITIIKNTHDYQGAYDETLKFLAEYPNNEDGLALKSFLDSRLNPSHKYISDKLNELYPEEVYVEEKDDN